MSGAKVLKLKPKINVSEEKKQAGRDRVARNRTKINNRRWRRKPGERVSTRLVPAGEYVQMACGCVVRVVNYTKTQEGSIRTLAVVENDACDKMASDVECRLLSDGDCLVPGIWRRRTPGYKSHVIGSAFYDVGQEVTVMDKEKLLDKWRKELGDK